MKKTNIKTTTYEYDDKYLIDIVETNDTYEAWLYNKNYGIKDMMFGSPKERWSMDEFLLSVEFNACFSIGDYEEKYN